jgi:hypothetical protein
MFAAAQAPRVTEADPAFAAAAYVAVLGADTAMILERGQIVSLPGRIPILAAPDAAVRALAVGQASNSLTVLHGNAVGFVLKGAVQRGLELPASDVELTMASDESLFLYGGSHPQFSNWVWRVGANLSLHPVVRTEQRVSAVAIDPDGSAFVASDGVILRVDSEGSMPFYSAKGIPIHGLCWLSGTGLLVHADGGLFVVSLGVAVQRVEMVGPSVRKLFCGPRSALVQSGNGRAYWIQPGSTSQITMGH